LLAALIPDLMVDFLLFAIMAFVGPYPFYEAYQMRRIDRIEERFPDFLRDIAEDRKVGMSLMHAVKTASQEDYGMLSKRIRKMATLLSWNVPFIEVLRRFSEDIPTPMIQESVSVIEKGFESGGSITDVFVDTAENAKDRKMLFATRESTMGMYLGIIYLAFVVFIVVVAVLIELFLPIMGQLEDPDIGEGENPMYLTLMQFGGFFSSGPSTQFYQNLLVLAVYIQSIGTGAVCGVLIKRRFIAGLRHSFAMMVVAYTTIAILGL
jgi:flagellar protein FlaJ